MVWPRKTKTHLIINPPASLPLGAPASYHAGHFLVTRRLLASSGSGARDEHLSWAPFGMHAHTQFGELPLQRFWVTGTCGGNWRIRNQPLISVQIHRILKVGDRCVWKACFVKRVFFPFDFSYLQWSYISELKRKEREKRAGTTEDSGGIPKPWGARAGFPLFYLWQLFFQPLAFVLGLRMQDYKHLETLDQWNHPCSLSKVWATPWVGWGCVFFLACTFQFLAQPYCPIVHFSGHYSSLFPSIP